ncbi:MAG: hypothetical protein QME75_03770 [Deltaproteobacteria bacterium]|nr:hypothetical protein [Deltaproteobacteria bacterium]
MKMKLTLTICGTFILGALALSAAAAAYACGGSMGHGPMDHSSTCPGGLGHGQGDFGHMTQGHPGSAPEELGEPPHVSAAPQAEWSPKAADVPPGRGQAAAAPKPGTTHDHQHGR